MLASGEHVESAAKRLDDNDPKLQLLIFFEPTIFELEAIVPHVSHHLSHLETIAIGGQDWGHDTDGLVGEQISLIIRKKIPCLRQIEIFQCVGGICSSIAKSLLENHHIQSLMLSGCRIGDEGAGSLAQILQSGQCALEEMHLHENRIDDNGCASIMNALSLNTSLKVLCLSSSRIGVEGCRTIAKALQNKAVKLQQLDLRGNKEIDDDGCILVANGLNHNTSLQELNLSGCSISCSGWAVMEKTLEKNYTLLEMTVDDNCTFRDRFDQLLCLNRERPVEAEIRKTGIFPHRLLKNFQRQKGNSSSFCKVEMLLKIMSFENLSALFSFIQENPLLFDPAIFTVLLEK